MTSDSTSDNNEQISEATDYVLTLKSELISLQNDIIALYDVYGEVNQQAFSTLKSVALMHDVSEHALVRLIEQIEASYIAKSTQQQSFVQWIKYLQVQFSQNDTFCVSELEKNTVISAAVISTGRTAESLLDLFNAIQSRHLSSEHYQQTSQYASSGSSKENDISGNASPISHEKKPLLSFKYLLFLCFIVITLLIIYFSLNHWFSSVAKPDNEVPVVEQVKKVKHVIANDIKKSSTLESEDKIIHSLKNDTINQELTANDTIDKASEPKLSLFEKLKQGLKNGSEITSEKLEGTQNKILERLDPINNEALKKSNVNDNLPAELSKPKKINESDIPKVQVKPESVLAIKPQLNVNTKRNSVTKLLENSWVNIPAGSFVFPIQQNNQSKQHHYLTSFQIMKTEVTFTLWDKCVAEKACYHIPSDEGWGRGNRPVMNVNLNEITEQFIPWLHRTTGDFYYLPSETQWEYVASLASSSPYHWGIGLGHNNANCANCGSKFDNIKTSPVKSFFANQIGLFDLHGNVWEFTQDCWSSSLNKPQNNGSPWLTKGCNSTVIKGGSYMATGDNLSISARNSVGRQTRNKAIGFRLIKAL